jgi:hypothetical protein
LEIGPPFVSQFFVGSLESPADENGGGGPDAELLLLLPQAAVSSTLPATSRPWLR